MPQPAGVRAYWVRIGLAAATLIPAVTTAPPVVTPAPLYPLTQAVRARPAVFLKGRAATNGATPVHNPTQGPPFRLPSQPARTRIPQVAPRGRAGAGNPGTPAVHAGPAVYPLQGPVRVRITLPPRGRSYGNAGAPVRNPAAPPVSRAPGYPVRSRIPQPFSKGHVHARAGAPVHNPSSGPPVRLLASPVRARLPLIVPGRAATTRPAVFPATPGAQQPLSGPAGVLVTLTRTGITQTSSLPSPIHNPSSGPVFRLPPAPVQARRLPARGGHAYGGRGAAVSNPVTGTGAPFPPLRQAIRARLPLWPLLPGRAATMGALPAPANPTSGVPFLLPAQPVQARQPLPPRGRVYGNQGAPVRNPAPPVTAAPYRLAQPVRARLPRPLTGRAITTHAVALTAPVYAQQVLTQPAGILVYLLRAGHVQTSGASPVHNPVPSSGPPFTPLGSPAGLRVIFARTGSGAGSPGAPVQNPVFVGAPVYPLTQPVRARRPLPAPGRAATMASLAVPVTPTTGVPFPELTSPARSRILPPPRGRVYGNKGAPVNNPAQSSGPPFPPLRQAIRARQPLPPRGRTYTGLPYRLPVNPTPSSGPPFPPLQGPAGLRVLFRRTGVGLGNPGTPVFVPVTPAPLYPLTSPVQARRLPARPGRTSVSHASPVVNPVTGQGPPVYPLGTVRFRITLPPRGRTYSNRGVPATHAGPVFRQATAPVRAPVPQPFSKGRGYGSKGAPVQNPVVPAPLYPLTSPVRARQPLPPRGRTYGHAGAPVQNPVVPFPPLNKALHAQPAVFLKGRVITTPRGTIHNPTQGPVFRLPTQPTRFRITLPPPGRVYSNAGAPIHNPVEGPPPPGTLYLTPGTIIQGRPYAATTITSPAGVLTITPGTTGILVISPAAEGWGPSTLTPPPGADFPPPDPVVVPAYVQR